MAPLTDHAIKRAAARGIEFSDLPESLEPYRALLMEAKRMAGSLLSDKPLEFRYAGRLFRASQDKIALKVRTTGGVGYVVGICSDGSGPVLVTVWSEK